MASMSMNRVASRISAPAASPRVGVVRMPRTVVFAEPRFTLENSPQASEGFVEKDTAGQSNMYPTIMKPFEAGSSADTVQQDTFNNGVAVGGAAVALGAIGLGLAALLNGTNAPAPVDTEEFSSLKPLSAYSATFAAELAPPAPVKVVEAPVLQAAPPAVEEVAVVEAAAPAVEEVAVLEAAAPAVEEVAVLEAAAPAVEEVAVVEVVPESATEVVAVAALPEEAAAPVAALEEAVAAQ